MQAFGIVPVRAYATCLRTQVNSTLDPAASTPREVDRSRTILQHALRYAIATFASVAAVQAGFALYQAHEFLVAPYNSWGAGMFAVLVAALATTCALALLGHRAFAKVGLLSAVLAPVIVVAGISRMAGAPLVEAFRQAVCSASVGMCFPQVAALVQTLAVLAVVSAIVCVAPRSWPASRSGV